MSVQSQAPPLVGGSRDAQRMRDYRRRQYTGEIGAPATAAFVMPTGPVVPWTDDEAAEARATWERGYRAAMAGWLLAQRSTHTRRAYEQAWRMWVRWCDDNGADPVEPGIGVCAAWVASMDTAGLAPATRRLRQYAVRSALVNLTCEGVRVGGDPFVRIKAPAVPWESTTVALTDGQVAQLHATARTMSGEYESALLLCGMVGLRAIEAGQVCPDVIVNSPHGQVARVVRKGGKPALVPIPAGIVAAAERDRWPHRDTRDMHQNAERVRTLAKQLGREAGVRLFPHQLRHWHVTKALELEVPLVLVQSSMGHADPRTTQRYNDARLRVQDHTAFTIERAFAALSAPAPWPPPQAGTVVG